MPSCGTPVVTWAVGLHSGRKVQHALTALLLIVGLARPWLGLGGDTVSFLCLHGLERCQTHCWLAELCPSWRCLQGRLISLQGPKTSWERISDVLSWELGKQVEAEGFRVQEERLLDKSV